MSHNIVKQHKGNIHVYSEKGVGTTFNVYLPQLQEESKLIVDSKISEKFVRGEGTVLVIDDEENVLQIADEVLTHCGYKVFTANGAEKGVAVYKENSSDIDLVILDMSMPVMSGEEVCNELRLVKPDANVLLSSGFSNDERVKKAMNGGFCGFLGKPYSAHELSKTVGKFLTRII